jgi:predicted patatin/cPLA2 family phospholipase
MAGQIGRTGRINLGHRHDGQYVGPGPLRRERSLISFDFLFRQTDEFDPLDRARFFDSRRRFAVVVSDCLHGEARYPERDSCDNIYRAIQASASMPYVSPMVEVDGVPCLDGGCCCKIPYQWALDQGYEKIVIVRTRHPSYRKKPARPSQRRIAEKVYRSYPAFAEKLIASNEDYNRQCDEIEELARDGRVFVLSPSSPMEIHRLEGDMEKLGALYWMGYNDLMSHLATLKAYLGLG